MRHTSRLSRFYVLAEGALSFLDSDRLRAFGKTDTKVGRRLRDERDREEKREKERKKTIVAKLG